MPRDSGHSRLRADIRRRLNGFLTQHHRPITPARHSHSNTRIALPLSTVNAMFSTKLSRAAHRATTSHTSAAAITATASTASTACACTRPAHQRRPSSSKASCPPDNNTPKAAPAAKAESTEAQDAPVSGRPSQQKSNKGRARAGYRRVGHATNGNSSSNKQVATAPIDQFAGLPSVPSLQGLDAKGTSVFRKIRFVARLT
jgi:hypothetical protein